MNQDLIWLGLAVMFGVPFYLIAGGWGYFWIALGTGFGFIGGLMLILFGLLYRKT